MLAVNMDEIGLWFATSRRGLLKFVPLGGWFDQVLLGQRVSSDAQGRCAGVIAASAASDSLMIAKSSSKRRRCNLDIGATSKRTSRRRVCAWATGRARFQVRRDGEPQDVPRQSL